MRPTNLLRHIAALVLAIILITQAVAVQASHLPTDVIPGELLVRLHPEGDPRAVAARGRLALIGQLPGRPVYRFAITDSVPPRAKASSVRALPGVLFAEPNYRVISPWATRRVTWVVGSGAEDYAAQWAPERIGLAAAQAISRGKGITVAIIDTGVDPDHPALAGHLGAGYDFIDNDDDPREVGSAELDAAYGHGTHVAGLVALVAPEARILPYRTLAPEGSGDLWTQLVAMHDAFGRGATVINLSFSFGERSRIFDETIGEITCGSAALSVCRAGRRSGAIVVAAAGNGGDSVREYPGATARPGLIGVAASSRDDLLSPFSTYGSWLPIAAPGEEIISAVPGGGYAAWSGTSMATPLVAGAAALVRAAQPSLGPGETARRIVETAAPIDGPVRRRLNAAGAVGAPAP